MFSFKSKNSLGKVKEDIVNEQKSPLFRIMAIFNSDEPTRRRFGNNICAFHIGNGYILSVAHNLRSIAGVPSSMPENEYQSLLLLLDPTQQTSFNASYSLDAQTQKRYLNPAVNQTGIQLLANILDQINYDNRWLTFYERNICKPFLIFELRGDKFYGDDAATQQINPAHIYYEPAASRYTFLLELELVEAFYSNDYALYRIVNRNPEVLSKIPFAEIDYEIYTESDKDFFCLQSAPADNLGRLLNVAEIEGLLDHWSVFSDKIGRNYVMDGLRYLIKGYFRFGSSGAPYFKYDSSSGTFKINAIQSAASPIQLSINGSQNGNFQYINAIASPIRNIEARLKELTAV